MFPKSAADAVEEALRGETGALPLRSRITEQRHTPTLRVEVAREIMILPYAYFQEARCRREGERWEVALYWPSVIVTVRGRNLERLVELIAEQGLAALEFRPDGEKSRGEDDPDFESMTVTPRTESPFPLPPAEAKPQEGAKAVYRPCYSVV